MTPELAKRWSTALRSGEFEQTSQRLHDDRGFCCLGVLCQVIDPEIYWDAMDDEDLESVDLPSHVDIIAELPEHEREHLAALNDGRVDGGSEPKTFKEIADFIDSKYT